MEVTGKMADYLRSNVLTSVFLFHYRLNGGQVNAILAYFIRCYFFFDICQTENYIKVSKVHDGKMMIYWHEKLYFVLVTNHNEDLV